MIATAAGATACFLGFTAAAAAALAFGFTLAGAAAIALGFTRAASAACHFVRAHVAILGAFAADHGDREKSSAEECFHTVFHCVLQT